MIRKFALSAALLAGAAPALAQAPVYFDRIATIEAVKMLPADRDRAKKSIAEIVTAIC
jgi:hypothetical protein